MRLPASSDWIALRARTHPGSVALAIARTTYDSHTGQTTWKYGSDAVQRGSHTDRQDSPKRLCNRWTADETTRQMPCCDHGGKSVGILM